MIVVNYKRYHDTINNAIAIIQPGCQDRKMFNLLGASALRFDKDFEKLVKNDPKRRWNKTNLHPFQSKVQEAFNIAGVSNEEREP